MSTSTQIHQIFYGSASHDSPNCLINQDEHWQAGYAVGIQATPETDNLEVIHESWIAQGSPDRSGPAFSNWRRGMWAGVWQAALARMKFEPEMTVFLTGVGRTEEMIPTAPGQGVVISIPMELIDDAEGFYASVRSAWAQFFSDDEAYQRITVDEVEEAVRAQGAPALWFGHPVYVYLRIKK